MLNKIKSHIPRGKAVLQPLNVLVALVSAALLIIISIDAFAPDIHFMHNDFYMRIQLPVCIVYLVYFFVSWYYSSRRAHYFRTHLLILFLSIPYAVIFSPALIHAPENLRYVIHFIPAARAILAMAIIVGFVSRNRFLGLFISYATVLVLVVYFSSLIFYLHEYGVNPAVTGYWEALWFVMMNTCTLGASFYAVTTFGKAVAIVCAAMGILMLPIFTAYLTNEVKTYVTASRRRLVNHDRNSIQ